MLATGYTGSAMQIADCWLVPQTKYRLQPAATGNAPFDTPLDDLPESDLGQLKRLKQNEKRVRKGPNITRICSAFFISTQSSIIPNIPGFSENRLRK